MVDRYDPDILWCLSEHVSPEIGPRRVSVQAEQGELRIFDTIVQNVPGAANSVEPGCCYEP
jgi:hypothetical protein